MEIPVNMKHVLRRAGLLAAVALVLAAGMYPRNQPRVYPAGGHATLAITGAGVKTENVTFPDELPGQFNAVSSGGGPGQIEVNFSRELPRTGGGVERFSVDIKTFPSGAGKFTIPLPNQPAPANSAGMTVDYAIADPHGVMTTSVNATSGMLDGVSGWVRISNAGGTVVGDFSATLHDPKNGFYKVSGTFSVRRQQ